MPSVLIGAVEEENRFLLRNDWFDFEFRPGFYGTIIANMSFSNHLIYNMENSTEDLALFLFKYREIIDSLKPEGRFVYAPSLPFNRRET